MAQKFYGLEDPPAGKYAGCTLTNVAALDNQLIPSDTGLQDREYSLANWTISAGSPVAQYGWIEIPDTVELDIIDTAPGVRGNSATGRTKPATLSTGHVIQVPEHLDSNVKVRVNTETGEYLGRAN